MVHDLYIDAVKQQSDSMLKLMNLNAVAEVTKHSQDLLRTFHDAHAKQMEDMLLKFKEMQAPEELLSKYLESMESLLGKTTTVFEEKTKASIDAMINRKV